MWCCSWHYLLIRPLKEQPIQLIIFNYLHLPGLLTLAFADTTAVCQKPFALADNKTIFLKPELFAWLYCIWQLQPLTEYVFSLKIRKKKLIQSVWSTRQVTWGGMKCSRTRQHHFTPTCCILQLIYYKESFKSLTLFHSFSFNWITASALALKAIQSRPLQRTPSHVHLCCQRVSLLLRNTQGLIQLPGFQLDRSTLSHYLLSFFPSSSRGHDGNITSK